MASFDKKEGQGPSDEKCKYYIKHLEGDKDTLSEQFDEVTKMLEDLSLEKGPKDKSSSDAMSFDALVSDLTNNLKQGRLDLMNEFISAITKQKEKHLAYKWLLKMFGEEFKCKLQNAKGDVRDVLKCLSDEECTRLNSAEEEFEIEGLFKILDEHLDKKKHLLYERFICAMLMLDLDRNLPVLITEINDPDPLIEALGLPNKSEDEPVVKVVNLYCHLRGQLIAGQLRPFNKFLFKLGDLHPDVFENLVGKKPEDDYLKHHIKDILSEVSKKILEQPFQADKEMDDTISGDNYVSLSIGEFNFGSNRSKIPLGSVRQRGGRPRSKFGTSAQPFSPDKNLYSGKLQSGRRSCKIPSLAKDQISFVGEDSNLEDLLNKSNDRYRRVLIQGRCGVGKTTMIQNMAYKWAQGKSLQEFYFFFIIKIRSLDKEQSMYELLTGNSLYPSEIQEKWLMDYPHRIFICIDGLDEMINFSNSMRNDTKISDINKKDSARKIVINLLRRNLLPKATVIATSRPFVGLDALKPDMNLEVKGLTQERIIEFISKNVEESKQASVKKNLRESPTLLSLCTFPYYASKITKQLEDHPDLDLRRLENTYSELHAFMILDHYKRQTTDPSQQEQFNKSLPALAAIAGYIFQRGGQDENNFGMCFDMDDTYRLGTDAAGAGEAVNQGEKYGLIQTTRVKTKNLVKFSHLSVQEMLAAVHFLKQSDKNIDDLKIAVSKLTDSESLEMLQIFLFAVVFDEASSNLNRLKWHITGNLEVSKQKKDVLFQTFENLLAKISEDERHLLKLCLLSYETKNDELAKKVSSGIKSTGLCMKDISLNAIDAKALVFVLKDAHLEEITLDNTNLSDYSCQLLLKTLETHNEIKSIKLTDNQIEQEETLSYISNLLMLGNLKIIDLSRNSINDECFKGLLAGLQQEDRQSITLNISGNQISAQCLSSFLASPSCNILSLDIGYLGPFEDRATVDFRHLAEALSTNRTLESLYLPGNNIGIEGAKALASAIKKMDSLQSLGLGNNNISDDGAVEIARALNKRMLKSLDLQSNQIGLVGITKLTANLQDNSEIHTLDLSHNNLGSDGAKTVAHFLVKYNTSLQTLRIGNNSIKSAGAKYIANALKTHTSLNALSVSDNDIGDDGARYIDSALRHNETLTVLSLRKNNIGDQGAKYIARALKENSRLEYLELSENNVGDDGAKRIGIALEENQTLSKLILERCPQIGDLGVNALANSIVGNKVVTVEFDFANPNLGNAARHLKKTPHMVYISPDTPRHVPRKASPKRSSRKSQPACSRKKTKKRLEVKPTYEIDEIEHSDCSDYPDTE